MADFVCIYVAEAHAVDGMAVRGNEYEIKEHQFIGKYAYFYYLNIG